MKSASIMLMSTKNSSIKIITILSSRILYNYVNERTKTTPMKLLMYTTQNNHQAQVGISIQSGGKEKVLALHSIAPNLPASIQELIQSNTLSQVMETLSKPYQAQWYEMDEIKFLPPLLHPGKILCIGLNYRDHALEGGREIPAYPTIFTKATTSLIAHNETILLSQQSNQTDYEAELAVVIGKTAFGVLRHDALSHVAGYTILNDVTARDYQQRTSQWTMGKSFDTFAPTGPYFVTADEIPNPGTLEISANLNGEEVQHSNTKQLIFDVPFLIEYISAVMTLEPGDIISTGTPAGVGVYRNPQRFLQPDDVISISVEGLGTLTNTVQNR